jgi:uncharacterized membrane protein
LNKTRLEAFSDGVLAVVITIMVLELKVPSGASIDALAPMRSTFFAYVLSFVYVGIYWNNHHHLMHTVKHVTGGIMWANLHLLFWLSLFPALTAWVGQYPHAPWPTALYGVVLLAAALAWLIIQSLIIRSGGSLGAMIGSDLKGKLSPLAYILGIGLAFVRPWMSQFLYALVAAVWIVPDRRIERRVAEHEAGSRAQP